jgi:hypothetical protein
MTAASDVRHLRNLVTPHGIIEHSKGATPRVESGICLDDVARLLIFVARESPSIGVDESELSEGASVALDFIEAAHLGEGRFLDRRDTDGRWRIDPAGDDARGRALWGLGSAVSGLRDDELRRRASGLFEAAGDFDTRHIRSAAFAVRGAGDLLSVDPSNRVARSIVDRVHRSFRRVIDDLSGAIETDAWPWPEQRLTYANAAIPEMVIILGCESADPEAVEVGLSLLDWLVQIETHDLGHLSPTPTGGRSRSDRRAGFDQQPIEISSLADACVTAWNVTGDEDWLDIVDKCVRWFEGENDSRRPMIDPLTGGGYDGLTRTGVNLNQGAESTLAMLSTLQHRARIAAATRGA